MTTEVTSNDLYMQTIRTHCFSTHSRSPKHILRFETRNLFYQTISFQGADMSKTRHERIRRQLDFLLGADTQQTQTKAFLKNADTQQTQTTAF